VGERDEKMARKITVTKSFLSCAQLWVCWRGREEEKIRYLSRFLQAIQNFAASRRFVGENQSMELMRLWQ
jgi:hypothetical protein